MRVGNFKGKRTESVLYCVLMLCGLELGLLRSAERSMSSAVAYFFKLNPSSCAVT